MIDSSTVGNITVNNREVAVSVINRLIIIILPKKSFKKSFSKFVCRKKYFSMSRSDIRYCTLLKKGEIWKASDVKGKKM